MNWRNSIRTITLLTILIFTAACSNIPIAPNTDLPSTTELPPVSGSPSPAVVSTQTSIPATGNTLCASEYYAIRQGATWNYQSTGSPAGTYNFTESIPAVRENGFTLTTEFGGVSHTQEWDCQPGGLVALQIGGPILAILQSQAMELGLDVKTASGVTFPSAISAGDQWQHSLEYEGKISVAGLSGDASGNAQADFSALGVESVTVPAGTFDAMKIQVDTRVNLNVVYEGMNIPASFTGIYNYWFAPNVGWVKATGDGNIAGQSFTENMELQSYNIP